jgi:hypothetical protein
MMDRRSASVAMRRGRGVQADRYHAQALWPIRLQVQQEGEGHVVRQEQELPVVVQKIAGVVEDWPALVDLDALDDVGGVAMDNVHAAVNRGLRERQYSARHPPAGDTLVATPLIAAPASSIRRDWPSLKKRLPRHPSCPYARLAGRLDWRQPLRTAGRLVVVKCRYSEPASAKGRLQFHDVRRRATVRLIVDSMIRTEWTSTVRDNKVESVTQVR